MSDTAIQVENLSKKYFIGRKRNRHDGFRHEIEWAIRHPWRWLRQTQEAIEASDEFWALQDVSFDVKQGEVVGIIGRNGAGKSTLLKLLSRITEPTSGRIRLRGRVASLLEVGTGFHTDLTGRENIFLNGAILGMTREEIRRKFDEIVAFSEIEKFLDTPVKRYSSGMYVRLAFAVAAHLEPEILIVDEVLAVGDVEFQKKCLGKIQSVAQNEQRTVLFVSHNFQTVRQICGRVLVLDRGQLTLSGDPHDTINRFMGIITAGGGGIDLDRQSRLRKYDGAHFRRVEFQDTSGRPAMQIPRGEDLAVEIHFHAERPLEQFDVAVTVMHVEGQPVFSEFYSDQHAKPGIAPGEFVLRFSLPMRFLKLESYFLNLTIYDGTKACDQVRNLPLPEVTDETLDPHVESHRRGVARIPVTWTPVRTEAAAESELISRS